MTAYDFSAPRLFVETSLHDDADYTCTASQANYLLNVLRLKVPDEILVFNGQDGEWLARIADTKRSHCRLTIQKQTRKQVRGPDIHYLFAPLKRARLDYMAQKAVELGVSVLQPVITQRTQTARININRLRANAIEAAEQCGVLNLPSIREPQKLNPLIDKWEDGRHLIYCDEGADVTSPIQALQQAPTGPLAVLIGPEGGFSQQERQRLSERDFVTVLSLGPRIMRADTAAVAALALVNAVLGDWC